MSNLDITEDDSIIIERKITTTESAYYDEEDWSTTPTSDDERLIIPSIRTTTADPRTEELSKRPWLKTDPDATLVDGSGSGIDGQFEDSFTSHSKNLSFFQTTPNPSRTKLLFLMMKIIKDMTLKAAANKISKKFRVK